MGSASDIQKEINGQNKEFEAQESRKPEKTPIYSQRIGNVSVGFAFVAWPDKNGNYGQPEPDLYIGQPAKAGYQRVKLYLSDIDGMIDALEDIRKLRDEHDLADAEGENRLSRAESRLADILG